MAQLIYAADDEKNIRELIKSFLESGGYDVEAFETGDDLKAAFDVRPCDLIVLDIMMPGTNGLALCAQIRRESTVPIILLTAKDTELDYVRGITMGSDDYLTKPFRPTVLLMRVRALLRRVELERAQAAAQKAGGHACVLTYGDLAYLPDRNVITCKGVDMALTKTESMVLAYLMRRPQSSFSREELLEQIWGFESTVETRVTDETVRRVRKKLSCAGSDARIETVWGYGYRLVCDTAGQTI